MIQRAAEDRLPELLRLRDERMLESVFSFYRGSSIIMAADLAGTPVSGFRVQACGDAHCLNFGGFATPERNLIFDINDFDETLPGPWEWDLKRLVASCALGARENNYSDREGDAIVLAAVDAYATRMREFAEQSPLNVWYTRLDATKILNEARDHVTRRHRDAIAEQAATDSITAAVERFTVAVDGQRRFRDEPPTLFHSAATENDGFAVEEILEAYMETLRDDVRFLLSRYSLIDHAIKVVGVGSVGSRCAVALLESHDGDAIILQIKEATRSVLEPYAQKSVYTNQGQRVVEGQRLMQAASDAFLGWARSGDHDFYVRQLRDMKSSANLESASAGTFAEYARFCGWALAAGHARSGDPAAISGYIGKGRTLGRALVEFAHAYAGQAERDYVRLSTYCANAALRDAS